MSSKSSIFSAYNGARRLAREGRLDCKRVNRALGVALSNKPSEYNSTARSCECPDRKYRGVICKHMLAAAFKEVVT